MKAWTAIMSVALVATLGSLGGQWYLKSGYALASEEDRFKSVEIPGSLCVDDLMENVDHYRGSIRVEGVVSQASLADQRLAVMDVGEFRQCGSTKCASLILPVRWAGAMPAVEDTVRMEGEVQDSGGKLIFLARKLEKVEPKSGEAK